jgi:hypothetical protein
MAALLKLRIELVPKQCWGRSIRRRLLDAKPSHRSDWNSLRSLILADQGSECNICGSKKNPHCHEVWAYDFDHCIQRLMRFQVVCAMCHLVTHIGCAEHVANESNLDIADVKKHFMKVNGLKDKKAFEEHKAEAMALWKEQSKQKSKQKWKMDLGQFGSTDERGKIVRLVYTSKLEGLEIHYKSGIP